MRILTKKCSDVDVRTFRQRWVVIVYAYSDEVIAIHKMAECDDLYFLDSPLLKLLLLTEKTEHTNDVFASRETNGEYHMIFPELLNEPDKFSEYFRMSPETFYYILNGIEGNVKKQSNFRKCISPAERLSLTLR